MRISIIVPSKGCMYLNYLMRSLRNQSIKPHEVILVLKDCDLGLIEKIEKKYLGILNIIVLEQKTGYVTNALNIGKKSVSGDIVLITDDDAIPTYRWVERYAKLFSVYRNASCISSRDIYLELSPMRLKPTPDDLPHVRLYRWFIRPILDKPHPILRKYRLGVYITRDLRVAHGPCIPYGTCFSLPLRGVNMGFSNPALSEAKFPEHPLLRRGLMFEQHVGLQLVLRGHDCIYSSNNPVLHIARASLSRNVKQEDLQTEKMVMRVMFLELLQRHY